MPIKSKPLQTKDLDKYDEKAAEKPIQKYSSSNKNSIPFDEMPIKGSNATNFNDLLEKKLGQGPSYQPQPTNYDEIRIPQKRASERAKQDPYK